ncbi:hypothetical protein At1g04090 [Andrographis paniculata]|uniref:hypothetical protein At1g04090 n=1 Tax=Andrographis paniculata TaxID=175694 RepID=UPI0021E7D637|nr:hypothetical protein At1g04090 [Andrographis paniculata]
MIFMSDAMRRGCNDVIRILIAYPTILFRFIIDCCVGWRMLWRREKKMLGCRDACRSSVGELRQPGLEHFSLPDPLPQWPQGSEFATSIIKLRELEVCQITKFEFVWGISLCMDGKRGVSFYKPIGIPDGFFCLGHYCQSIEKPLRGFVLVAREIANGQGCSILSSDYMPPLLYPVDYSLVWSSEGEDDEGFDGCGYFWLPQPPEGYKPLGFLVTNKPEKPDFSEIRCVRADLTDECEPYRLIVDKVSKIPFTVCSTRPRHRGIYGRGVSVGTFYCSSYWSSLEELNVPCLKNLDPNLCAMPNVDQIHALVRHYGPTLFFHPDEIYLPSSVSWFFRNGACLYSVSDPLGVPIDAEGSNLPRGGTNDGKYWIDVPDDSGIVFVRHGNLESAKLYLHVKPALGGTFTDIAMWIFCPFNGPGTLKLGMINYSLGRVGQHLSDWEHFTLRISNFTGELWSIYFSQHSGGEWVDASDLEFIDGNKAVVYSSKSGHASFPHPGIYLQGSSKLGIGVRNDAARSNYYVDSSRQYEIVAAEYLGDGVVIEPHWLQYMRKWGPRIVYDSRKELDKIINSLPPMLKYSMKNIISKLPLELCGEDGPTGPKEKNNWFGDERW